jgi:NTP pyrophosphatase (non-canonical NTP hydrolase)
MADACIHLAEETGEVSETVNVFLGEHKSIQFEKITQELADWVSCMFGVANSSEIDITKELVKMYSNNCHVCHKAPCVYKFEFVYKFRS